MLLAEDLLLLLTDDTSGKLSARAFEVELVLAGASLVDLALMGRVDISREVKPIRFGRIHWDRKVDRLIVGDPSPTGDAVLDTALRIVIRGQNIYATWPMPSARDLPFGPDRAAGRNLQLTLYKRLGGRGMVRHEPSIWALGNADRWPAGDDRHKVGVRRRVIQALVEQTTPDTRSAVLIALLHTIKLEPKIVDPRHYDGMSKMHLVWRGEEIADSNLAPWASEAVRNSIDAIIDATRKEALVVGERGGG